MIKRTKIVEEAPVQGFKPIDLPPETAADLLSLNDELFGDFNFDFIESLIEANRALNYLTPGSFL